MYTIITSDQVTFPVQFGINKLVNFSRHDFLVLEIFLCLFVQIVLGISTVKFFLHVTTVDQSRVNFCRNKPVENILYCLFCMH